MKRFVGSILVVVFMFGLIGCIGGIGNKQENITNNVAMNVQITNGLVTAVMDNEGNWMPVESAPVELLIDRGVVKVGVGAYRLLDPNSV